MSDDFEALIDKVRNCVSYEEAASLLEKIVEQKKTSDDPNAVRALRDAEVYALCWGVHVAMEGEDGGVIYDVLSGGGESDSVLYIARQALVRDVGASSEKASEEAYSDYLAAEWADKDYIGVQEIKYFERMAEHEDPTPPPQQRLSLAEYFYLNDNVRAEKEKAELKEAIATICSLKGQYLMVTRKTTTGGGNVLIEQGVLESVDEEGGTFVLKSTVYEGRRDTVSFSDVRSVDTSRSGPGARGPVSTPDWRKNFKGDWVRSDKL